MADAARRYVTHRAGDGVSPRPATPTSPTGFAVQSAAVTFDYRGMGPVAARQPARLQSADILDWARLDCAAALAALEARFSRRAADLDRGTASAGRSALLPHHARLSKAITIGTGRATGGRTCGHCAAMCGGCGTSWYR